MNLSGPTSQELSAVLTIRPPPVVGILYIARLPLESGYATPDDQ